MRSCSLFSYYRKPLISQTQLGEAERLKAHHVSHGDFHKQEKKHTKRKGV